MAVGSRNDDLAHTVGLVDGLGAFRAAADKLGSQRAEVVGFEIAKPVVRKNLGGGLFVRAVPEHEAHAVALGEPPVRSLFPKNAKAQHVAIIGRASVEITDGEN